MKTKLLSILIVAMLSLGLVAFALPVKAVTGNEKLYADPADKTLGPTPPPVGIIYTVNIKLFDAQKVTTIATSFVWDPTMMNVTALAKGDCLPGGSLLIGGWDSATGVITDATYGVLGANYDVADGLAFVLTVKVMGFTTEPAGSVLDITGMSCWDVDLNEFLAGDSAFDHTLHALKPGPTDPTASFFWTPPMPQSGNPVTFDASASTAGFDGTQMCPITEYRWDWENDGIFDDITALPTIIHTFALDGTYSVKLEVYAPPGPTPDPIYQESALIVHDVIVSAPPTGRNIDLYTCSGIRYPDYVTPYTGLDQYGGQVDSYAPQDLVTLHAKVTYNLEPVAHKEVAFEIRGPINPYYNVTIMRQAPSDGGECNVSGIATIEFRIPWPCSHPEESVFGNWTIMSKVSIAEETVVDTHWFYVGWIVDTVDIVLHDSLATITNIFQENTDVFVDVTVNNIAMMARNVTVGIVIYDELEVPIGSAYVTIVNAPPGLSTITNIQIHIPEWAYIGMGTVYVNLFTKLPAECGICWCPEHNTWIKITPDPAGP